MSRFSCLGRGHEGQKSMKALAHMLMQKNTRRLICLLRHYRQILEPARRLWVTLSSRKIANPDWIVIITHAIMDSIIQLLNNQARCVAKGYSQLVNNFLVVLGLPLMIYTHLNLENVISYLWQFWGGGLCSCMICHLFSFSCQYVL